MKNNLGIFILLLVSSVCCSDRESLDVLEEEEVTLTCRFDPVPEDSDVTLYWIRNNRDGSDNAAIEGTSLDSHYRVERFPSLGRYDLKIENTTYDRDNGNFKCMVKEAGTGALLHTKRISLTVLLKPSPPRISPSQPTAKEGEPLNLTCSSTGGSPPPQVRWYREGESQLLDSSMVLGANREEPSLSVLTILPTKNEDGAVFRCTVWNRALGQRQKLETKVQLSVNYFPRVTIGGNNPLRVEEGDTAVMTCQVDSKPKVDSVKWTREGRYIATTFRHVIPTLTAADAGPYYCEADNNLGQTGQADLTIIVLYAPRVTLVPAGPHLEVSEGETVTIECRTDANPAPVSYEWRLNGKPLSGQTGSGQFLRLAGVSAADAGNYTCTATNILDPSPPQVISSTGAQGSHSKPSDSTVKPRKRTGTGTITLAVRHRPGVAYITPAEPVGEEGKPLSLRCGASPPGYPPASFKWWRQEDNAEGDEDNEDQRKIFSTGPNFMLRPVRLSSAGRYYCQPFNELGEGSKVGFDLEVVQAPKVVSGLQDRIIRRDGDTGLIMSCSGVGRPAPRVVWYKDGLRIGLEAEDDLTPISVGDNVISDGVEEQKQKRYTVTEDNLGSRYRITVSQQSSSPSASGSYPSSINVVSTIRFTGDGRRSGNQVGPDDAGEYRCRFENSVGTAESAVLLRVEHAPLLVTSVRGSADHAAMAAMSATHGNGGSSSSSSSASATSMAASRLRTAGGKLAAASSASVSAYTGSVYPANAGGHYSADHGHHRYWGKVAADPGDTAELVCRMKAFPAPTFTWERVVSASADGTQTIRNSARFSIGPSSQLFIRRRQITTSKHNDNSDMEMESVESNMYESVLKVYSVKEDVYGEFVCVATNSMGSAKTKMALVRKGRPDSPTDLQAVSTEANRMVVTWLEGFDGGFNGTRVNLQYRELGASIESAQEKYCDDVYDSYGRGPVCELTGLKQHTTYILRAKASNRLGESPWSEPASVTTEIDVSQIPGAESVYYEKSTRSASFKVASYPLSLQAKLEVLGREGWTHLASLKLDSRQPYKFPVKPSQEFENVRIRLCLESNDRLCGPYAEASTVDKIQEPHFFSEEGETWLIPVVVCVLLSLLICLAVLIKCCCFSSNSAHKKLIKKEEEMTNSVRPDLLHPSLSFDNKVIIPDKDTGHLYLQNQETDSGSGNAGSVNSQDSLWHVKDEDGVDAAQLPHQHHLIHGKHQHIHHNYEHMTRLESDYAHYPQPEEYLANEFVSYGGQAPHLSGLPAAHSGIPHQHYTSGNPHSTDEYAVPRKMRSSNLQMDSTLNGGSSLNSLAGSSAGNQPSHHGRSNFRHFQMSLDDRTIAEEDSGQASPKKVIREIIV